MRVYLHELSEEPKHLSFSNQDAWLKKVVEGAQEAPLTNKHPETNVTLDLHKSQDIVFIRGKMKLNIGLYCSRCANAMDYPLTSQFECMFTSNPQMVERSKQASRSIKMNEDLEELECLSKDFFELEDVLKEQIYLRLPLQPLCKEDCKGVCPVCGQDRNINPCQCHRIKNTALSNALKNFKA